ncbi:MAG: LysM peptidoglycan-binding domain-containing protein [Acidimicrobiales bacterium]
MYRRRRLIAAAIVAGVLLAGLWAVGLLGSTPLTAPERAPSLQLVDQTTYVVRSGDTLWSIARRAQPSGDIRPLVDRLAARSGGHSLQVGDRITVA